MPYLRTVLFVALGFIAVLDIMLVRVAFFFDDGVILHDTWPYEEYIEWMTYDEDE
jgi:hypothetical protein